MPSSIVVRSSGEESFVTTFFTASPVPTATPCHSPVGGCRHARAKGGIAAHWPFSPGQRGRVTKRREERGMGLSRETAQSPTRFSRSRASIVGGERATPFHLLARRPPPPGTPSACVICLSEPSFLRGGERLSPASLSQFCFSSSSRAVIPLGDFQETLSLFRRLSSDFLNFASAHRASEAFKVSSW